MGVGTGISVGTGAVATVQSRKWLLSLASVTEARLAIATGFASLFGGVVLAMERRAFQWKRGAFISIMLEI